MTSLAEIEPLKSLQVTDVMGASEDQLLEIGNRLELLPQIDCPLLHKFSDGVYIREILMPRGTLVIGHRHKTRHFNIVLSGRAAVMMDGVLHHVVGPCTIESHEDVRKVLYIFEPMRWITVHANPDNEREVGKLEERMLHKHIPIETIEDRNRLKELVDSGEVK